MNGTTLRLMILDVQTPRKRGPLKHACLAMIPRAKAHSEPPIPAARTESGDGVDFDSGPGYMLINYAGNGSSEPRIGPPPRDEPAIRLARSLSVGYSPAPARSSGARTPPWEGEMDLCGH